MKLSTTQILLYIIFIISVIIISYYYTNCNSKINNINNNTINNNTINNNTINTIEPFYANDELTLEQQKLDNELESNDINDIEVKTKLINYLTDLQKLLKKTETMDVAISINNNGNICDEWGMYSDGKYKYNNNNCIKINNSNKRRCLSNNILTSCSNYYKDDEQGNNIDKMLKIDTEEIMDRVKYNTFTALKITKSELSKYNDDIDNVLSDLISKRNLENQQLYFINYNNNNLNDKQNLFDKTNKEFEKAENDVNINKIQFQEFLEKKEILNKKNNSYYYYVKILIILLIVVGLFNFMFTELL
tara:strand:+ start:131 stop:1042 length:912 start_codon:yes stop_codon:yes gene_type:complete